MVTLMGVALGVFLTLVVIGVHFTRGVGWKPGEDISQQVLERRAATVPETGFPEPMNRSIGGGIPAGAITVGGAEPELEEVEEEEEGPWSVPDDEAGTFDVEFVKEGASLDIRENETILDAGEDEGWDLPYACREGQCLSCGAHIPDGPAGDFVVHHNQEMLSEDELDEGYVLTCVAYPTADLSIETRETP